MCKEVNIRNNLLLNTFLMLIDFINSKNIKLNLKVSVDYNRSLISEVNSQMFFKFGQLLMFFYITNINGKDKPIIRYKKGIFYAEIYEDYSDESYVNSITAENIIYKLIDKSTYNKKFFIEGLDYADKIDDKSLLDIQSGFELTYKTFIDEKTNIINFLNECGPKNIYLNLIKDIKLLNYHDLGIQLTLIKLKFQRELPKNKLVENITYGKYNYDKFIENSKSLLDMLTKNSIISFYNNKVELMWFGYINEELKPIKYLNIYLAIYFAYIAENTEEKYYLQSAKNALNPLLDEIRNINDKHKEVLGNDYYCFLEGLYLLSHYIEYDGLNKILEKNIRFFSNINLEDKLKTDFDIENLILEFIYHNSLNLINSLILI